MSVTLTISEKTYQSLEHQAQKRQLESVERLLEELSGQFENEEAIEWQKELERRREIGRQMKKLREKTFKEHGYMPDSTELIRQDRMRG